MVEMIPDRSDWDEKEYSASVKDTVIQDNFDVEGKR